MSVLRVRTKETLCRPEISQLLLRGARKCGFPSPGAFVAELARDIAADWLGVFVGIDGETPRFAAIGQLPLNAYYLAAAVHLAYSEKAPHALVVEVGGWLREWLLEHGQKSAMVVNLFHTDRSYIRGLGHFGRPSRVGGVIRFDF